MGKYVFISYSTQNQEDANAVRYYLGKNGVDTWMAPYDIPPGDTYARIINQAIKNCSCCVLILSNASQQSIWVPKEIERVINYQKILIPISIENVILNDEFEFYISTNQIVNVGKLNENSPELQSILAVIKGSMGETTTVDKESNDETAEIMPLDTQNTLFFGNYYYGLDGEKGPVEWIILKEENGRKLLLSKYIIDAVDYHEAGKTGSWKECSLRRWLNTEFTVQVFSKEEKDCLIESERAETRNFFYNTEDSDLCRDKVFLLSVEEVKSLLNTCQTVAPVTPYALEKGVFANNYGLWWIRTPGDKYGMQAYINTVGKTAYDGCYQQRREVGLRPAIWVSDTFVKEYDLNEETDSGEDLEWSIIS